ncbi:MAG TPA: hypothetical protein VKE97_05320 [Acidimicrobiia bacterium]|nr:hypothetical protein [Acidimicrobiia bacterium]
MRVGRFVSTLGLVFAPILAIGVSDAGAWNRSAYHPKVDPADFNSEITNPYFPLTPGTAFVYEGTSEGQAELNRVKVTSETRHILGVDCLIVHDVVEHTGVVVEDTFDWYAQDKDGNVWYFGEDTRELDARGRVKTTEGSWEAGQHGAEPGIVMPAHPTVGNSYRQEYRKGVAEDRGRIIQVGETRTTPTGTYDNVVVVAERTRLEPKILEHKEYAPGIGLITENVVKGAVEASHLARIERA